jgi:class 3 adenylate cyclase/pimeloyl-ACP methyl ester carboxylesterase
MGEVRYAQASDGTHIAYRVLDALDPNATLDILFVSIGLIPMDSYESEPGFARLLDGLTSLGRVVLFDRRGLGSSDPIVDWDRLLVDQWADDLAAVIDAAESAKPVVFATDGYGVGTRYAANHPDRVDRLVLYQPVAVADEEWKAWVDKKSAIVSGSIEGGVDLIALIAPSVAADPAFLDWYTRAGRVGASPATATRIWKSVFLAPVSAFCLPDVRTPTLVLYRRDNKYATPAEALNAAARIPGSVAVELDGADHFPFLGDVDALTSEIAAFVVGERRLPPPERLLAAVLFTDLVDSTAHAASVGDTKWKSVLDRHDEVARNAVGRRGGTVVKTTGDGILAIMPSATAALRAAVQVRRELDADGLPSRIGVHVGDIDRRGDDVSGLAVNIAARVMARAQPGEIVVTAPVIAATTGDARVFVAVGTHELKGVPGEWQLFRLADDPSITS